ncbi:MAG TPA: YqhA family protein [Ktedonobacteraceae bacterium]|nr:YqhA family protein [Ktedonobacteraceae bacterium]HEV2662021.1 YqhA family protein [Ktedonobacteraceae bacterium]
MLRRILASSRYLVVIAVIGSFLTAVTALIYGGLATLNLIMSTFSHLSFTEEGIKHFSIADIEIIDLFLLGTVLYITALGLYELFIDEKLVTPRWLEIHNLDDLKEKLIGVIVVLLAVTFLAAVVSWDGSTSILSLGVAVGLVLLALALLLRGFGQRRELRTNNVEEPTLEP